LSWGERNSGQLGIDNDFCARPQVIESLQDKFIVDVSAGGSHSLVVTDQGKVWAFGSNLKGQLGNGTVTITDDGEGRERLIQVKLCPSVRIMSCSGGGLHSLALSADGSVFSWGCNLKGQCGAKGTADILLPHHVSSLQMGIPARRRPLDEEGSTQFSAARDQRFLKISAGFSHSVLLRQDARVFCLGVPGERQARALPLGAHSEHEPDASDSENTLDLRIAELTLPHGLVTDHVTDIAASASLVVAVTQGRIFTWGLGSESQHSVHSAGNIYNGSVPNSVGQTSVVKRPPTQDAQIPLISSSPHPHPRNELAKICSGQKF
jgi:alpha-tubulin suppressor-like RCC1 family protein